jgi:hypothetical protein
MRRKLLIIMITIWIVILHISDSVFSEQQNTDESELTCKIVVLRTFEKPMPTILESKPGTAVIWVNYSLQPQEILFIKRRHTPPCRSPVNFFINMDGAYESNEIPFGGTASLCFLEEDIYMYRVKPSTTFYPDPHTDEYHGIIIIK